MQDFQQFIFHWWKENRRDLPWRKTRNPYHILVSEVMLQQTQVARVLPKYKEFLQAFPTVPDLAAASPASVLRMWKGMGYNRRALYLQKTAQAIVSDHKGKFPQDEKKLLALPGIGKYTARAILVFGFKKDVSMVDTNVRQIITHFFYSGIPQKEKIIDETAERLVPIGKSWEWHQALMDFGALELKNLKPRSPVSPISPRKSSVPFRQTNRFFRGRVMDMLRVGDMKELVLITEFAKLYDKDESFIQEILAGLVKDGLIARSKKGTLSLPD